MSRANKTEGESRSSLAKSDIVLLIVVLAFTVFLAVAVFIILTDTRGLWYPEWEPPYPTHPIYPKPYVP